ncbi:hypothetical protein DYB37_002011 [Aphanomyces astaci]|uniref:Uncharacterized protein n=1 Tax=Aphanomyces astaci TaxID=112090 RepID=A0A3R7B1V6_APHAT|nr:hypothetical protein DYB37_002011 [Aphanomyces astaci]
MGVSRIESSPDAAPCDDNNDTTTLEVAETGGRVAYLVLTLGLSLYYLHVLTPVIANDLWWAGFNVSGAQTYLIDVVNAPLNLADSVWNVDVTATGKSGDYSTYFTPVHISPVYGCAVVASQITNLSAIIAILSTSSTPEGIPTQYC